MSYTLFANALLEDGFAELFRWKTKDELQEILASWKVENRLRREGLWKTL